MTERPNQGARDEDYVDLNPGDPDWDLSEEAGYGDWEPERSFSWAKWLIIGVILLLVASFTLPLIMHAW